MGAFHSVKYDTASDLYIPKVPGETHENYEISVGNEVYHLIGCRHNHLNQITHFAQKYMFGIHDCVVKLDVPAAIQHINITKPRKVHIYHKSSCIFKGVVLHIKTPPWQTTSPSGIIPLLGIYIPFFNNTSTSLRPRCRDDCIIYIVNNRATSLENTSTLCFGDSMCDRKYRSSFVVKFKDLHLKQKRKEFPADIGISNTEVVKVYQRYNYLMKVYETLYKTTVISSWNNLSVHPSRQDKREEREEQRNGRSWISNITGVDTIGNGIWAGIGFISGSLKSGVDKFKFGVGDLTNDDPENEFNDEIGALEMGLR